MEGGEEAWVTLYLGSTDHRQYAGPDALETMASTILHRYGVL